MVALWRNVSRKQAMEMLLTGEPISARAAQEIGLVNRVVAAGTERDAAIALAEKVALESATVKLGKAQRSTVRPNEPCRCLSLCRRGDDGEHDGARRRGRHRRVPVVDEALRMTPPPKVIWMQLGARDDLAAARAEAAGLKVVMNRCPRSNMDGCPLKFRGWASIPEHLVRSARRCRPRACGFH